MSEAYGKAKELLDKIVYNGEPGSDANDQQTNIPWEQQALFSRLQSFTPTTWFGKPSQLNPAICALKGWRNTGPDTLTCDTCGCKVLCKLPANPCRDSGPGILRAFVQQLTDAHDAMCSQHKQIMLTKIRFPVIPSRKLVDSLQIRLQGLQRLDLVPGIQAALPSRLAAAAQQLDPALTSTIAAVLKVPADALLPQNALLQTGHMSNALLPKQQALLVLALCGWRVQPLLPQELINAAAPAAQPGSASSMSHLVPRSGSASGRSQAAAGSSSGSNSSSTISSAHSVLQCELCGCRVGLWRFSCSGPFYAQQLVSRASALVAAADSMQTALSAQQASPTTAAGAMQEGAITTPTAVPTPLKSTIAGGPLQGTNQAEQDISSQQQQQTVAESSPDKEPAAPPAAVASRLCSTIAGGSLLAPGLLSPRSAGGPLGMQSSSGRLTSPVQAGPFGAPVAPVFGSPSFSQVLAQGSGATAANPAAVVNGRSSSGLFGMAATPAAIASVFGDSPPPAGAAGPIEAGPFGPGGPQALGATVPVFGIRALKEEEQRTKRRRSSITAAEPGSTGTPLSPWTTLPAATVPSAEATAIPAVVAAAHAGSSSSSPPQEHSNKQGRTNAETAAGPKKDDIGSGAGDDSAVPLTQLQSFMRRPSLLSAAVVHGEGNAAASSCFDPIGQHRPWCPWVNRIEVSGPSNGMLAAAAGSSQPTGTAAALSLGWTSTLLALQEQLEEQQLLAGAGRDSEMSGEQGWAMAGQFETTAAVLAKARRMLEVLEQ